MRPGRVVWTLQGELLSLNRMTEGIGEKKRIRPWRNIPKLGKGPNLMLGGGANAGPKVQGPKIASEAGGKREKNRETQREVEKGTINGWNAQQVPKERRETSPDHKKEG